MENIQDLFDNTVAFARDTAKEGMPASYIPELGSVDPALFSLSMTALDGAACSSGDAGSLFSMHSISKVGALCFALESLGRERVFSKIGMKPCSESFNSILKLEMTSSIPLNLFINAGAIVLANLSREMKLRGI
jgi:glutaminase